MKVLLGLVISHLFVFSSLANDKLNACFITINSSEEKHLFKKSLSSGENAGKFNFHEFIPEEDSTSWFKDACKKKIKCDILVISGHYGGKFFGEGSFELDMKELEKASCDNSCPNLLSSPKEVFLLGCNTLAGKEKDSRDPIDYLNTLLRDGFDLDEASLYTEQRYGKIGSTFKNAMKRVFKGVPRIYGFDSLAPSGNTISPYLSKYLKKKNNYSNHLLEIEVNKSLGLLEQANTKLSGNKDLAKILSITHFDQTAGLDDICNPLFNTDQLDPNSIIAQKICALKRKDLDLDSKHEIVKDMLLSEDIENYIPTINDYLDENEITDAFKKDLKSNQQIQERFNEILKGTKTGLGMLKAADIGASLGLVDEDELLEIESKAVKSYLKREYNPYLKQAICTYKRARNVRITEEDIDTKRLSDLEYQSLLQCLKISDLTINDKLLEVANSSTDENLKTSSLLTMSTASKLSETQEEKLKTLAKEGSATAYFVLSKKSTDTSLLIDLLPQYLSSDKKLKIGSKSDPINKVALYSVDRLKAESVDQLKPVAQAIQMSKFSLKARAYFVAKSLFNLDSKNAKENIMKLGLNDTEFEGYVRAYITVIKKKKSE